MGSISRRGLPFRMLSVLGGLALAVAACGDDDGGATTTTAPPSATTTGEEGGGADAAMAELIAAAEEEGSVTIYSSQALDNLNAFAEAFEAEYDVDVEVVRGTDADLIPRVETELATSTSGGDLVILAAQGFVVDQGEAGSWVDPTASPELAGLGEYDAAQYLHEGDYFEVGAAVLTFAWNTQDLPDGLESYEDVLDPDLAGGRIGVIDPAISSAVVDFYLWLEDSFGEDYVSDLAEQEPRIYPSALPTGEALTSGEISAAIFAAPAQLEPAKAGGAPVDYGIDEAGAWGARYYGVIPKSSDSPNAAALLANFMLTPLGQELVQGISGSVLPDIPGTLITNDRMRVVDLEAIAPEPAAAYVDSWNSQFR